MANNIKLSETVTSYYRDNKTNSRKTARDIQALMGNPKCISYNTLYYWSVGRTNNPYSAYLLLPLLYERASGPLKEFVGELMTILDISQPVQS